MTKRRSLRTATLCLTASGLLFASFGTFAVQPSAAQVSAPQATVAPESAPFVPAAANSAFPAIPSGLDAAHGLPNAWPVTNAAIKSDRLPTQEEKAERAAEPGEAEKASAAEADEPSFVQFGLQPLSLDDIVGPAMKLMSSSLKSGFAPSNAGLLVPRPEDAKSPAEEQAAQLGAWARTAVDAGGFRQASMRCLTEAIYFEARGESAEGQAAVAQVILNRVHSQYYPDTVCDVVYQNQERKHRCQFSFACDGEKEAITNRSAWQRAEKVAGDVGEGRVWLDGVSFATHYHATYVKPPWIRDMVKADTIGSHIFYRVRAWDVPDPEAILRSASAEAEDKTAVKKVQAQ